MGRLNAGRMSPGVISHKLSFLILKNNLSRGLRNIGLFTTTIFIMYTTFQHNRRPIQMSSTAITMRANLNEKNTAHSTPKPKATQNGGSQLPRLLYE